MKKIREKNSKYTNYSKESNYIILKVIIGIGIIILILSNISSLILTIKNHSMAMNYFNSDEDISIQEWMHPRLIEKEFNLSKEEINSILNTTLHPKDTSKSLSLICREKKYNCDKIISQLNTIYEQKKDYKEEFS